MPHASSANVRQSTSRRLGAAAFAVGVILYGTPGWAAKVYRCGNVFQDLPCPEPKPAEQRPAERPAPRDAAPCSSAAREGTGRSDCIVRTAPRDTQAAAVVEAKR